MKIAVTGGSGFIGAATIAAGERIGHEMWSFDRNNGHDIMGGLNNLKGAEAVIHLAGMLGTHELFDSIEEAVLVNVAGSTRIMEWCLQNSAAYVGILMPDVFPSLYTATKMGAKRVTDVLVKNKGLKAAHVRAYNAYGPGQKHGPGHPQKILPTFATAAWRGEPIPIFGSGDQTVDMIHVDDLGRMLIDAVPFAFSHNNLIFDGGTGVPMTVREVAHVCQMAVGGSNVQQYHDLNFIPMRKGEVETNIYADGENWSRLTWRPRHDLRLMAEAVQWYRPRP